MPMSTSLRERGANETYAPTTTHHTPTARAARTTHIHAQKLSLERKTRCNCNGASRHVLVQVANDEDPAIGEHVFQMGERLIPHAPQT